MMTTKKLKHVFLHVIAVLAAVIIIFPIYVMLISSFKPITEIFDLKLIPNPGTFTFGNYIEVFESENFGLYILNSLIVATTVTAAALFFHSMAGYSLARLNFP
ncbi:MAG: carbohydrate ABC transporter permease, partial [Firmicutes bacterium]|nr:carbohydrate ABC transporter permease [Bacillota bacterium]